MGPGVANTMGISMKTFVTICIIAVLIGLIWLDRRFGSSPFIDGTPTADSHIEAGALIPVSLPKARTELPSYIPTTPVDPKTAAFQVAMTYLDEHREEWQIQNYHELRPSLSGNPSSYVVTYQAFQENLPVMGMEIRMRMDQDSQVVDVQNGYHPVNKVDLSDPEILTSQEAMQRLPENYVVDMSGMLSGATREIFTTNDEEAELAYAIQTKDADNNSESVRLVINAVNGEILSRSDTRDQASLQK
jgi:Zn-dependent metalloprotease